MVGHPQHRTLPAAHGQADLAGERVAKVLARAGVASRREVERLIEAGKVALNGQVLMSPAVKVGPRDILTVDGAVVSAAEATRVFRYHKPAGLMTTHRDPKGRATVFDALPAGLPRLISVGRLDLSSEGLLLLTNDGGLARALELPSSGWKRRYRARALGRVDHARLDGLKDGITIEGVRYGPIEASLDKLKEGARGANVWITLVLAEGKNREVRRVLEALGLKVNRLIRIAYGPFALGTLAPGAVEEVGPRVIREQLAAMIAPASLPTGERPLYKPAEILAKAPPRRGRPAPEPAPPKRKVYKAGWAKARPPKR
jgi:23S rRNA pseudouridine2605 synthase